MQNVVVMSKNTLHGIMNMLPVGPDQLKCFFGCNVKKKVSSKDHKGNASFITLRLCGKFQPERTGREKKIITRTTKQCYVLYKLQHI